MKTYKHILISLLLYLISSITFAYDYDPLLLRAQATIFPKIVMLDENINQKINGDTVSILIISSTEDKVVAKTIKKHILDKYKNKLGGKVLSVQTLKISELSKNTTATAYIILKTTKDNLNKVTSLASKNKRIVFSYDYKDFINNTLISVHVREKTYVYLNKSVLHDYDIKFIPLFYKIVKVVE